MTSALPPYTEDALRQHGVAELMRLLARDEDRVPRNVIDECATRGDEMLDSLAALTEKDYYWEDDVTNGEWWRLLHAVMILGLMPGERAGDLLVRFMRRMDETGDEVLEEWLSGNWPAFFRNKPASVVPLLQSLGEDSEFNWYIRGDAVDSAIAWVQVNDSGKLDETLDRAARMAFSRDGDFDTRVMVGNTLLGFARARDRHALEQLADAQPDDLRWFGRDDVIRVYAIGGEPAQWERFANPWKFYEPSAIEERQKRWEEEDVEADEDELLPEPFVRDTPKIGRNDPCPCGSGKKYKKCCMA